MGKFTVMTDEAAAAMAEHGQPAADYYREGAAYYHEGQYASAFRSFKQAADLGSIAAAFSCGVMYRYGEGVEQNLKQALNYLEKAAVSDEPTQAIAASVDTVRAIAADKGTAAGDELFEEARLLNRIAESTRSGHADEDCPDDSTAGLYRLMLAYYKASAEEGVPEGMFNCGCLYARGLGTDRDLAAAKEYLEQAGKEGVPQAEAALSALSDLKGKTGLFRRR